MQNNADAAHSGLGEQHRSSTTKGHAQDFHGNHPQRSRGSTYHNNSRVQRESVRERRQGLSSSQKRAVGSGVLLADSSSRRSSHSNRRRSPASRRISPTPAARLHHTGARSPRASRMSQYPIDIGTLEDSETPPRRRRSAKNYIHEHGAKGTVTSAGRRSGRLQHESQASEVYVSQSIDVREGERDSSAAAASAESYHFRVRLHECRGVFANLERTDRAPPAVYFSLHTAEECSHTKIGEKGSYNPFFLNEFMFSSADPEHDALVCTLVTVAQGERSSRDDMKRGKKIAECVVALHNLLWHAERKVWVPLVHHSGTPQAYEQGEVLVSIYSEDFGYDTVATEDEEAACSAAIHDVLVRYAPEELHRLDWLTATYVYKGTKALMKLCASYRSRIIQPVPVRLTVHRVDGLTDELGRPTQASEVYVVVSDGCVEQESQLVPYRRGAVINGEFKVTLANPQVDTLNLMVFGNGRKLGEAVAGLTNVQAGKAKAMTLMLVRAAETGDASNGGQVSITLQTRKYSSPNQMTPEEEGRLRERVLAYLWCYLRDDLHRLDAIVSTIDSEEKQIKKWTRTFGPEKRPKRFAISVRGAQNIFTDGGSSQRCYARISAGPTTLRTELVAGRSGAVSFRERFTVCVYDPVQEAVEVMIVADGDHGEREVGRVCLGVANLPRQRAVVRTLHLVAAATKRDAHLQGEVAVELVAEDFGLTGTLADAAAENIGSALSHHIQRLEAIFKRNAPEKLHRVPFMLDSVPPGEAERVIEHQEKQYGVGVAVAPMTVKVLGFKEFKPAGRCHVKVYLNEKLILRTRDVKGSTEVFMNIDQQNETTIRLKEAAQALMTFKVAQHSMFSKTMVLGTADVALMNLVRGERNVLWLPLFRPLNESASSRSDMEHHGSAPFLLGRDVGAVKDNRMPNWEGNTSHGQLQHSHSRAPGHQTELVATAVGMLGVELQSAAFPVTTVTEYNLNDNCGRVGESPQEAVTYDVTSLLAKMRPAALSKVQPMIAQCTSLKAAHDELRAELSTTPIAATVYVNIESVDLVTEVGKAQEARGEIVVEAICGSERQRSRKQMEFENNALHQRESYTQIRLDIPERSHESIIGPRAPSTRSSADASGGVPALELRLLGVYSGGRSTVMAQDLKQSIVGGGGLDPYKAPAADSDSSTESYFAGGENNIQNYMKISKQHAGSSLLGQAGQKEMGAPSKAVAVQQQQRGTPQIHQWRQLPSSHNSATDAFSYNSHHHSTAHSRYRGYGEGDDRYRDGGLSNGHRYRDPSQLSHPKGFGNPERALSQQHMGLGNSVGGSQHPTDASLSREAAGFLQNPSVPYKGDIGVIRLSLRALLTKPLYKVGDRIRVPIVAPIIPATLSQHTLHSPEVNQRCIVAHVTLRLNLPAFEHIPGSLRLDGRHSLSKLAPGYVHYYERRIGAFLRSRKASDLVTFHYNLYERDVVSGCWPVSLRDWMQTLIEQCGPEVERFGPVPALPFDLDELEMVRRRYRALCLQQATALASSSRSGRGTDVGAGAESSAHSNRTQSILTITPSHSRTRAEAADRKRSGRAASKPNARVVPVESVYSF